MTTTCPQCGAENALTARFCKKCGNPMQTAAPAAAVTVESANCPTCRTANQPHAKFCKKCGTPLGLAASPPVASPIETPKTPFRPTTAPVPTPPGRGAKAPWIAGAVAVVMLAGGAFWWNQRSAAPTPEAVVAPTPALEAAATPAPPPPAPAPVAAAEPAQVPAAEPPTPEPPVVPVPMPAATHATAPATPASKAQKTPPKRVERPQPPAPQAAPVPTPVPLPAPAAVRPTPVPGPAAPSGPSSPKEACGKRVFLALAICMSEQCNAPQFTRHPQCVELREQNRRHQEMQQGGG